MALPSSGQLSIGDISTELSLAKSNVSLGYVSDVVGFTEPDAISDFYGYSATAGSPDFAIVWSTYPEKWEEANDVWNS